MEYLNLDLIKSHLNVNSGYTQDDQYFMMLGDVVEDVVERHIDDSFEDLTAINDGVFPAGLKQAMLLLLGTYYSNRENIAYSTAIEVPMTYNYLIDLYRNYAGGLTDVHEMLKEINERLNSLESYVEFDKGRRIEGEGLDVTTTDSGQTTVITIQEVDGGEY